MRINRISHTKPELYSYIRNLYSQRLKLFYAKKYPFEFVGLCCKFKKVGNTLFKKTK